ncbi:hypothetical protein B0T14DRAFT_528850 [Immersiella caudata]|uniref:C2H2-type domain-containing protein n=1 Tax=Immersiella caudata TaxID=314043 RepID=A0AA39WFW0_9PEZI|nr:hypothetical protein B0T14DRAFT_528850 [Immersiella caudata]
MSDSKQPSASNRHGQPSRPQWDQAVESCGDFITTLPGGKTVWMAKGPAATVWRDQIGPSIRKLLQSDKFIEVGVSFFLYMIGEHKSTSKPKIIFCSSDPKARRAVRDAVRASSILETFPAIGLGDSSSPLARSDSGLDQNAQQLPVPPRSQNHRPGKGEESAASQKPKAAPSAIPQGSRQGKHVSRDDRATIAQRFTGLTITNCSSSSLSAKDSISSSLARSGRACSISCTLGASMGGVSLDHRRESFDTPTVKAPESDALSSGTEASAELSSSDFDDDDDDDDDEDDDDEEEEESLVISSPHTLQFLGPEPLEKIIGKLLNDFDSYRPRAVPTGNQGSENTRSGASQFATQPSGHQEPTDNNSKTLNGKRRLSGEGGSSSDITAAGSKRAKTGTQKEKMLACPYWKKDSGKYAYCFKWKFKEVKRMKEHLRRCHSKIRCPRCQEDFCDTDSRDLHIRAGGCELQPDIIDERLNESQIRKLGARGSSKQTQYDRWYVVWDILFPGIPKPDSPFIDDDILCEFREYCSRRGRDIILDHMRTSEDWHQVYDEERFRRESWREIFNGIFDAAFERWLGQRGDASQSDTGEGAAGATGAGDASKGVALDSSPSPPAQGNSVDNGGNENQTPALDPHLAAGWNPGPGNQYLLADFEYNHVPMIWPHNLQ